MYVYIYVCAVCIIHQISSDYVVYIIYIYIQILIYIYITCMHNIIDRIHTHTCIYIYIIDRIHTHIIYIYIHIIHCTLHYVYAILDNVEPYVFFHGVWQVLPAARPWPRTVRCWGTCDDQQQLEI